MATYSQDGQPLAIETPLGKDKLLLESFTGEETLGGLFSFRLECLSVDEQLSDKQLVGKEVSFRVDDASGSPRWFTGWVSRFAWVGRDDVLTRWLVEVVPGLWFATLTSDCKIFQKKSVPDIVSAVLGDVSEVTLSKKIQGSHPPREYCVQYRETDFAFVSRLMEHEGIGYHFEHGHKSLKMVVSDSNTAFADCKDGEVETAQGFASPVKAGVITSWRREYTYRPGKFVQSDYDYQEPKTDLLATGKGKSSYSGADKAELFDYPGLYDKKPAGEATAKVRIEAEEVTADIASGTSTCRSFSPGFTFKIKSHPAAQERGKKYLLTRVVHRASNRGAYEPEPGARYEASDEYRYGIVERRESERPVEGFRYENSFEAVPGATVWRPARNTPWPTGTVQTALVVGPSGEEIYTDKLGRIKVQFHWDRYGKKDDQSSCWIRVSQSLAGPSFGMQFIPRVGMEVVVSHLDDDPDRPLVTGVVYNGTNGLPFELPSKAPESGLLTRSTKQGSTSSGHKLVFDDTKDKEKITLHSTKDHERTITNNEMVTIGNGLAVQVAEQEQHVVGSSKAKNGSRETKIWKDDKTTLTTGNSVLEITKGDRTVTLTAGNRKTEIFGNDETTLKTGNQKVTLTAGNQEFTLQVGNHTTKCAVGGYKVSALQGIELTCGPSSIKLDPTGVTIKGLMVKIEGTTMTEVQGLLTKISASAMLQAQGAITMIN